jgi:hypothetical protein
MPADSHCSTYMPATTPIIHCIITVLVLCHILISPNLIGRNVLSLSEVTGLAMPLVHFLSA